jgi:signal transduction histidine kinase
MFTKLRNRVLILSMVLTTLILAAAFTSVYLITSNSIHAENQSRLEAFHSFVFPYVGEAEVEMTSDSQGLEETIIVEGEEQTEAMSAYTISISDTQPAFVLEMDATGAVLAVLANFELDDELSQQAAEYAWQHQEEGRLELAGRQWLYALTPLDFWTATDAFAEVGDMGEGAQEGSLIMMPTSPTTYQVHFIDITESLATLQRLLLTLVLVGLVALVAVFLVSWFFANRSIRPVEQAWEQQRRFIADASHELKTPLSIITTNSDALLANEQQTIASQREWLDYLRIGTDRMQALIDGLLRYAHIEEARTEPAQEPVDLSQVAKKALDALHATATERRLTVTTDIEPEVIRLTDRKLAEDIFFALVDNAVKYADEGGTVELRLQASSRQTEGARREGQQAVFAVTNSGPGIAEKDMPHIFERFYRASEARGGEDGSYGLGLSIVKAALARLGGNITVQSTPHAKTTFAVKL